MSIKVNPEELHNYEELRNFYRREERHYKRSRMWRRLKREFYLILLGAAILAVFVYLIGVVKP